MASRDVELVVKAKDESSKTLESIVKALNDLSAGLNATGKTVDKGETTFTKFGKSLSQLDKALRGMSSADRLSQQLDKATLSTERLDRAVSDTEAEVKRLAQEMDAASQNTQKYAARLDETSKSLDREKKALKDAATAHKDLNSDLREAVQSRAQLQTAEKNLSGALATQQDRLAKYQEKVKALAGEMSSTDEPTKRLVNSFNAAEQAVRKVTAQVEATQSKLAANKQALEAAAAAEAEYAGKVAASEKQLVQQRETVTSLNTAKKESVKFARDAASAEAQLGKEFRATASALTSQQAGLASANQALGTLQQNTREAQQSMAQLAQAAQGPLTEAYRAQQSIVSRINNAYQANRKELAELSALMGQVGVPTKEMADTMNRLNTVSRETATSFQQETQVLRELRAALGQTATDSGELAAKQKQFASAIGNGAEALTRVTQQVTQAGVASQKIVTANRAAQQSYAATTASAKQTADTIKQGADATDKASQAYIRHANASRQAMSFIQRLRGEVLSLISAYGGIYAVVNVLGQTVEAYKTLEAAQSRLNALRGGDQKAVANDLDFVRRNADRLGIQFGVLAQEYTKFAASTKSTVLEGQRTRDVFLAIAEAGRVNKLSLEDMGGIFKAVTQIASKGKFQLEELSGQLGDRLPGALNILADGLGITVKELLALTKEGKVSSDHLIDFANELNKRYGGALEKSLQTLTTAMGRLGNAALQALLSFGEQGFLQGFVKLVNELTNLLKSADFQAFAGVISSAFGVIAEVLAVAAGNFKLVSAAISALIAIKLAPAIAGMLTKLGELGATALATAANLRATTVAVETVPATMGAATTATNGFSAALKGLFATNAVGLAVTAIAVGISLWATTADEASKALEEHGKIVDAVKGEYDKARGAVTDWGAAIKSVTKAQAEADFARLTAAAQDARKQATQAANGLIANNTGIWSAFQSEAASKQIDALKELITQFKEGSLTVDQYKAKLQEMNDAAANDTIKGQTLKLLDAADGYRTMEEAIHQAELVLKVITGTAEESKKAMDELLGVTKDTGEEMAKTSDDTGEFEKAIEKMTGVVDKASGALANLKEKLKLDEAFQAAANAARNMGELNTAIDAYNKGIDALAGKDVDSIFRGTTTSMEASKALLRDREGFQPTGKWDNNAFRAGFGSDTITLADNSVHKITEGMRVSVEDANRDLERRIGEFQNVVTRQIGPERFQSFTAQQQAALTSVAYNYGSLPDRILGAVRTGTNDEISTAIKGLGGDNQGVNRNRRNIEAATFTTDVDAANKAWDKKQETDAKHQAATTQEIADNNTKINQQNLINEGKGREAAIETARAEAKKQNPDISEKDLAILEEQAGKLYDLNQLKKEGKNESKEAAAAEAKVNALLSQRNALQQQLKAQAAMGDTAGVEATKAKLAEVNTELTAAIDNAQQMWQAIGGTAAEASIARLETAKIKAADLKTQAKENVINWTQVGDLFANGLTNAFDSFAQAVANGEDVGEAARNAFLQFAADFLIEIGKMIIRQTLLNLLRGLGGPFAGVGGGVGIGHTGGIVGSKRIGSGNGTRSVNPAVFNSAPRFHDGGVVGLKPGEVPAVLKENEEVLKGNDPRNILNGGAAAGGGAPAASGGSPNIRIVNSFDAGDVVSQGMSSSVGEQTLINVVRSNRSTIRDILEHG
jgi:tape measure domain-containing protein